MKDASPEIVDALPGGFKFVCALFVSLVYSPNFADHFDFVLSAI